VQDSELIEQLKLFILENSLPMKDLALFGILCPLCGKTDRIRELENPQELQGLLSSETTGFSFYKECWEKFIDAGHTMAVCKFCNTPLKLNLQKMEARILLNLDY